MRTGDSEKRSVPRHSGLFWCGYALCCLIACGLAWFYWNWNPLPKDEEMIANFRANRADFEEIVRRYREYPGLLYPAKGQYWYDQGDTLELFKRAGIGRIKNIGWRVWFPNPYSVETALEIDRIIKQNDPRFPDGTLWQRYGALILVPATTQFSFIGYYTDRVFDRYRRNTLRFGTIWKDYVFIPEVPHVENGILYWALQTTYRGDPEGQFHDKEGVTTYQIKKRVMPTLNHFPPNWKSPECVFRQIEPQWFIRLCNGR